MLEVVKMLNKLYGDEIIKGFVGDYPKIKDDFKKVLYDSGFRWKKDSYTGNEFGVEGLWINYGLRLSIRARWGKTNSSAIIYVEKEFFGKVKKFFDLCFTNEGMDSENSDYDLLNKGELFKKDEQKEEDKKCGDKKPGKVVKSKDKKSGKVAKSNDMKSEKI
jgi:hypothetical protein